MEQNYWQAIELFRSLPTAIEGIRAVAKGGALGTARNTFLHRVLLEAAFDNQGDNSHIAEELKRHKGLSGDVQIDKLARLKALEARHILLCHDNEMWDAGFWEETRIPGIDINLQNAGDNLKKRGVHLIHAGIGSGKTSNVMLPLVKNHAQTRRKLVIVPNEKRVYELAAELGWAHYHTIGNRPDDIRAAIKKFDRLVICAASLRHIEINGDWVKYDYLFIDELTEIFNYAQHDENPRQAQFWHSLQRLFEIAAYADGIWAFTADAPTGYTKSVVEQIAREYSRKAYYYRTEESWGQYQQYHFANSQEDAIWTAAKWINEGQSAWGYCDVADYKGELTKLGRIFQRLCPDKKIEWWDSDKIKNHALGQPIREMGLVEYVKHKRREGELDAIIFSPVARTQYSVLFEEDEIDLAFDFAFGLIRSASISSPWDADQGLGRARQTTKKLVWIDEQPGGARAIDRRAGQKEIEKNKMTALKEPTTAEILYWHNLVCFEQYKLAGRASRKWLFALICAEKGASALPLNVEIPDEDLERYLTIAKEVAEEVNEVLQKRIENDSTRRLDILNRVYERLPRGWGQVSPIDADYQQLQKVIQLNKEGAETLFRILLMNNEERNSIDEDFRDTYYATTGLLLDMVLTNMLHISDIQKQTSFFDWFVNGDEHLWFEIDKDVLETADTDIANNYELVRASLNPSVYSCGTLPKFLKMLGDLIGLDLVLKVAKEERTKWRDALLDQYKTTHPGKFPQMLSQWGDRYAVIDSLLREKIKQRGFVPTPEEIRMLDTMTGIVRATKKTAVARSVVEVYRHYLMDFGGHPDPENIESDLRFSENSRNRNMVRNGFSEKSAS